MPANARPPAVSCAIGDGYQFGPDANARRCREFEPTAIDAWLARLSEHGRCQTLVSLVLKLERLAQVPLDGPRLLSILQRLTVMVRDVIDDLPRYPPLRSAPRHAAATLSFEQRLYLVTFKNLKRALEIFDRTRDGAIDRDAARAWLVGEMFACLGRQIEYGARHDRSWPPGSWQELHDLFEYFVNRMRASPDSLTHAGTRPAATPGADPETAYKRLLLIGLCAAHQADDLLAPDYAERLAGWALATELLDPRPYFGVFGNYLVEAASDTPPRLVPGAVGRVGRAWVLGLPPALRDALAGARAGRRGPGASLGVPGPVRYYAIRNVQPAGTMLGF